MKKLTIRPFFFVGKTHEEMAQIVNKKIPIRIPKCEYLIDKIHDKYFLLNKTEISLVVVKIFETFREILILGRILNIHHLLNNTKLFFYLSPIPGVKEKANLPNVKINLSTPPDMRLG
jgi:hypothetical protein